MKLVKFFTGKRL